MASAPLGSTPYTWIDGFASRNASDTPAANRQDHGVQIGRLRGPFVSERRCTHDRPVAVERMHEIAAFLGFYAAHDLERFGAVFRHDDLGAEPAAERQPRRTGGLDHHDLCADLKPHRGIRDPTAWLPADTHVTPASRSLSVSASRCEKAPRVLKVPPTCSNSNLKLIGVPSSVGKS